MRRERQVCEAVEIVRRMGFLVTACEAEAKADALEFQGYRTTRDADLAFAWRVNALWRRPLERW